MIINNLDKCCKPRRIFTNFRGDDNSQVPDKVKYKHYEELSDDILALKSLHSATKEVNNSGKMRFLKALPYITTGLVGASVAIAQPGKLADKAGAGLGFLAVYKAFNSICSVIAPKIQNHVEKKSQDELPSTSSFKARSATAIVSAAAVIGGAFIGKTALDSKALKGLKGFLVKEANFAKTEINNSKLAKLFDNTLIPFAQQHKKLSATAKILSPVVALFAGLGLTSAVSSSLSKDIKEKAEFNFAKGKYIQAQAREHFEALDAQEV